jgi:hypothetical protein
MDTSALNNKDTEDKYGKYSAQEGKRSVILMIS